MASLLLVAAVAFTAIGSLLAGLSLVRGSGRRAAMQATVVLTVVALYGLALVAVGVASSAPDLARGRLRCFDDWCVTVADVGVVAGSGDLRQVTLLVASRARRVAQRPDSPAAFLVTETGTTPVVVPGLDQRLEPGQEVTLRVTVAVPADAREPRFLVTEGGFPSRLVIGDENSPWHAWSMWRL